MLLSFGIMVSATQKPSPDQEHSIDATTCNHPERIQITFDDRRLVANAELILPATLALHLGLPQLVDRHLDLSHTPGRAILATR